MRQFMHAMGARLRSLKDELELVGVDLFISNRERLFGWARWAEHLVL